MRIHVEGNQYVFYIWVKAGYQPNGPTHIGEVRDSWMPEKQLPIHNRYAVFETEHGDNESGFSRQDMARGRSP